MFIAAQVAPLSTAKEDGDEEVWIRGHEKPHQLADVIIDALVGQALDYVDLACVGASPVNQAMKAVACARQHACLLDKQLYVQPFFSTAEGNEGDRITRLILRVVKGRSE